MSFRFASWLVALLLVPALALAEGVGSAGTVRELEVNTVHAETYLQHHGRIVLATGKTVAEYRWGGMACGTRTLDDAQVALLQRAMTGGLKVQPRYQDGQNMIQCLVGFTLVD